MKYAFGLLNLVVASLMISVLSQTELNIPDNLGREFVVGFGPNGGTTGHQEEWILTFSSQFATDITINFANGAPADSFTLAAGVAEQKRYAHALGLAQNTADTIQQMGIQVLATKEIALAGTSIYAATTDAFMGLPVNVLGTEYLAVTHGTGAIGGSYIQAIAAEDGTVLTFTLKVSANGHAAGVPFSVTLNKFDSVMYEANSGTDISGSRVSGSKNFALFAGHNCANVPTGSVTACDHINNQMPPMPTLGTSFQMVPFLGRTGGDYVRVVARNDNTVVSVDGTVVATLQATEQYAFTLGSSVFSSITSTEPIIVLQLIKGVSDDNTSGDPAMAIVPPISQWANNYIFAGVGPLNNGGVHYVGIAVLAGKTAGVTLDGAAITGWTASNDNAYMIHRQVVTLGSHTVQHSDPSVGVFVMVHGLANYDSYAFPGGQRFAPLGDDCVPSVGTLNDGLDNDCDGQVDEELVDGIDNDGDGSTDEDNAGPANPTDCTNDPVAAIDYSQPASVAPVNGAGTCVCLSFSSSD